MHKLYTLILLLATLLTPAAQAYDIDNFLGSPVNWPGATATIRASSVSFPTGSSFTSGLQTVINRWNNNPSPFNFTLVLGDTSVGHGNFQNETWFAAAGDDTPPAECWNWSLTGNMIEADVVFYTDVSWTNSMSKTLLITYGGSFRPFQTTAMHEFGHALGLNHENAEYNIMGEDWTHIHLNGSSARSYFGEDAADGTVALYGTNSSAGQDVSVVHFKRTGADGEYSLHDFTEIRRTNGTTPPTTTLGTGELRYTLIPGHTVQVEFSYENNGRSTQTVDVGIYLSTNNFISTGDTKLGSFRPTLGRNDVYTRSYSVVIPSSLASGDYFIGAIVDDTGSISEFDESNNAAYLPIRIN